MNVGWGHLDAAPGAWEGLSSAIPPFADRVAVGKLLGCDPAAVGIVNVWFGPRRSLRVVYRAGDAISVVTYGDEPVVRELLDDPGLAALTGLVDRARASERVGAPVEDVAILSYLPGERCAVRYRGPATDVVAKIARREDMVACQARQHALYVLPGRRFRMAEPLGVDAEGVRLERTLDGERAELLLERFPARDLLAALSAGAEALHAAPVAGRPPNGSREILARMRRKTVPPIVEAIPALGDRLAGVLDRLEASQPPAQPPVAIHGDLHTANVLFGAGLDPGFIDLDNVAAGDAAYDLALFASRLMLLGLVADVPVELPAGYGGPDAERFRWYLAATLVGRQVKTCVRHLAPGVAARSETLVAQAEALIPG
jgi:Phosphotransferase enzyme family